mmetsp:Transcript_1857/g.3338  ORF Transcript_1857/g.3338 Transcript_1857/m.3338 type:complete len:852 (-) Transcript_1857:25-2580(-)
MVSTTSYFVSPNRTTRLSNLTPSTDPNAQRDPQFLFILDTIEFVLQYHTDLFNTAKEIIDIYGVIHWLVNLNNVPDNYSTKALIKIIVQLGELHPQHAELVEVQAIMKNAFEEHRVFAGTNILEVHQQLPQLIAKRYFTRHDPELLREVELDEVFPLNASIVPARIGPVPGRYPFEFVPSELSEYANQIVQNTLKLSFQTPVNRQELELPLIKGPSGCGKTRMGVEAVSHGMEYLQRMNPPQQSKRVFIEMLDRPELDSSLYCNTDVSGSTSINGVGYLAAILVFALRRQEEHPSPTLLIRLMKGFTEFNLDNLMVRLRQILRVPVLFLHLDEYRDDLVGSNALITQCTETLRYGQSDSVVRIVPIITGMTSYIDGDAVSDAFQRTSRDTSKLAHVTVIQLRGLGDFPSCVENLEKQFLKYLIYETEGRRARTNELRWVEQREGNVEWPNLRPFLNDIDGYPRFYQFALVTLTGPEKRDLLLTYAEKGKMLRIHDHILNRMGRFFSQDTWASQVTQHIEIPSAIDILHEKIYHATTEATIVSLQMLLILAITEVKVPGAWTFGEIDTQHAGKVCLELALLAGSFSGLYQVTGFADSSTPIGVAMPPLVIAALNKSAPITIDETLTCIPRQYPVLECMEALRLRLVARSYATGKTVVAFDTLREEFHESYNVQAYRNETRYGVKKVTLSSKDCFNTRLIIKEEFDEKVANVDNLPAFIASTNPHALVNGVALIPNNGTETHPLMLGEEGFMLVVTVVTASNESEGQLAGRIIEFINNATYTESLRSDGIHFQFVIDIVAVDSADQAPRFDIESDFEKRVMEIVEDTCEGCLGVAKTIIRPALGRFPNAYRCN